MRTFWTNLRTSHPGVTTIVTGNDLNGTILMVGGSHLLEDRRRDDRVEDLQGGYVTAGFWDSHFHLTEYGRSFGRLRFSEGDTREVVLGRVEQHARTKPPGEWIIGAGWNHAALQADPDKERLDRAGLGHPVLLMSLDYHTAWINQEAQRRLGVTVGPEGILRETAAFHAQEEAMRLDATDPAEHVARGMREAARLGLVGVTTMEDVGGLAALQSIPSGAVRIRTQVFLRDGHAEWLLASGLKAGFGSDFLRVMGVKLFMDGALGSHTAWMKQPYADQSDTVGMSVLPKERLLGILERLTEQQAVAAVHAIGDRAIHEALLAFKRWPAQLGSMKSRLEHAQLLDDEDLALSAQGPAALSLQPCHLMFDRPIADQSWGPRGRHAFRIKDILGARIDTVFGSDAPIADPNPLWGLWAAVHRGRPGDTPWYPEQRISVREAIQAYTESPARIDGRPSGRLEPGCWGDLTVWSEDLEEALIHKTPEDIRVVATIVGGRRLV